MTAYVHGNALQPTPVTRASIVPLLLPLLPAKDRPKLAEVRHVPLGMFMSLYGSAFTISDGKRVVEKKVLLAFDNAASRRELRRRQANSPDAAFFEFIGLDNQPAMFRQQHWSHYPDLYRKLQRLMFDLNYSQWDKLQQVVGDLYLRPTLLMDDGGDPDARYMADIMIGRLQVWSNILTLAHARPTYDYYDNWV